MGVQLEERIWANDEEVVGEDELRMAGGEERESTTAWLSVETGDQMLTLSLFMDTHLCFPCICSLVLNMCVHVPLHCFLTIAAGIAT